MAVDDGILVGLAQGLEKGTANFFNAMGAVQKARLSAEKNRIDEKKAQLDLKKMELEMDPDVVAQNKELLNSKIKAQKSLDQFNIMKITREARKVKQDALQHKMALDFFQMAQKDPEMRQNIGVSGTGQMTYRPSKSSVVTHVSSGGSASGGPKPMTSREMPAGMPAASDYQDGSMIEDDSGQRYTVKNGQWIMA